MSNIESSNADMNLVDIKNISAVKIVDNIIIEAVKRKSSDIHIEPFEKYVKIRFRIDGHLYEYKRFPFEIYESLALRIKVIANIDIAEKRLPKDGRIIEKIDDNEFDFRVSTLPSIFGEKIVIRILNRNNVIIDKGQLGLKKTEIKIIDKILRSSNGMLFITGPTGSGKTTTLYTLIKEINLDDKNIVTVEDPVEYMIDGVNQVNINVKSGLTFTSILRAILRQDPDVIMIGEIRDSETAEIAVRAAITGHLVLSTLHTYNCVSTIIRLIDMGIEPYLIAASISGIVSQRLVRKICPYCQEEYEAGNYEKYMLGIEMNEKAKLYRGRGCAKCNYTGYKDRTGVFEVLEISNEIREAIITCKNINDLKKLCVDRGMVTLENSCKDMVLHGLTTIDEYLRIVNKEE
ncbi:type IV pilus assembly protein PilB [Caloramator quimbayensis]|uniref:Type IV pilus assembly protein PilB n=1 Tax=Caloramator quimbayensis TaxID=1147123 RepID=A0A1T4WXD7_9CLOT|nr:GspE/PulE family protein [Caloramator quimbayensis]SKA81797.1 type IV pilus assembly protein PilB [Caloramator quimbayensis]